MDVDVKAKKEDEEGSSSSSEDEGAPPRREAPKSQTFGDDPSTFPDPTVYEIRDVTEGMSNALKREIYSVAVYPKSDLADLIAGDPPNKDFSNAKPSSQINYSTFTSYIEPYFRQFSEEDLAFLRERGDRISPFTMPKRGKRHYSEIWAEEDNIPTPALPPSVRDDTNQPRGSIDAMTDSTGETDGLSIGPLASRLLAAMRPEHRAQQADDKPALNGSMNGDMSMNGDAFGDDMVASILDKLDVNPPAAFMMESSSDQWKKASHPRLDYAQVDERLKQELKYMGFLPDEDFKLDYEEQYDDEVTGRLRELQRRLKEQMLVNGARKARLADLVRERLAFQEYETILEDLDSQVQGAYTKRTRTIGKSKKAKRPGGAGGGSHFVGGAAGMARPGIGDMTRTLMERRRRWIDLVGSVFEGETPGKVPREEDPASSIFKPDKMEELMAKEKEQWDEEVDE